MKHKSRYAVLIAFFGLLLVALPALAHHSVQAEFYQDHEWTQTGVLTRVDWINPHSQTWITVKNSKSGKEALVACQGHPPNAFSRAGLKKKDWAIGEVVTITCLASKDNARNAIGTPSWGFIKMIKFEKTGRLIVIRDNGV